MTTKSEKGGGYRCIPTPELLDAAKLHKKTKLQESMLEKVIIQMESLQKRKRQILEEEEKLMRPTLTDKSLIGNIYDMFLVYMRELHPKVKDMNNTIQRSKFIFLILFLYSPKKLFGRNMKNGGLRDKIAAVTGCDRTHISHNCKNVLMYYRIYSEFHKDVDWLYGRIVERLKEMNLL
jgi:hypothetical protein